MQVQWNGKHTSYSALRDEVLPTSYLLGAFRCVHFIQMNSIRTVESRFLDLFFFFSNQSSGTHQINVKILGVS